eukprot:1555485-Pleurochrysis_carterae.AAC.1
MQEASKTENGASYERAGDEVGRRRLRVKKVLARRVRTLGDTTTRAHTCITRIKNGGFHADACTRTLFKIRRLRQRRNFVRIPAHLVKGRVLDETLYASCAGGRDQGRVPRLQAGDLQGR